MRRLLQLLPYPPLVLLALVLGLAPLVPQPHLLEKLAMLGRGQLVRPLDIFDLLLHAAPLILLLLKLTLGRRPPE